jgi:pimeloyl-ACP methyl ester carboxylesterase
MQALRIRETSMKIDKTLVLGATLSLLGLAGSASAAPQKLDLKACDIPNVEPGKARCGVLEVFENRATAQGRKLSIHVAVIPASGPDRKPDPIVFLDGGPGEAPIEDGGWIPQELPTLFQHRDLVLVDLRGTGQSAPLVCTELLGNPGIQKFLDEFLSTEGVKQCRARLSKTADLRQYNSETAMDDLDDVLAALGYDQVNLFGGSYGTRSELVYMRRHPGRVRSAVMEGIVPTFDRSPLMFARSTQDALDGRIAECEADAACSAAFPKLREEIAAVLARTAKEPVSVRLTDPKTGEDFDLRMTRNAVAQTIRYMLYSPSTAARIPVEVHAAAQGDFRPLAESGRAQASGLTLSGYGYFLAVTCAEDVGFIQEKDIAPAVAGTFLGDFRVRQQQAACRSWDKGTVSADFVSPVTSDAPALLISGQYDPATPASDGEKVVKTLQRGRHIVVPHSGHGWGGLKGADCLNDLVVRFFEAGSAENLDTSCVSKIDRPDFVLKLPDPEVELSDADLNRFVGSYNGPGGIVFHVERVGKRLRGSVGAEPPTLMLATSPNRFRDPEGSVSIRFDLADGKAASAVLEHDGGQEIKLTRNP